MVEKKKDLSERLLDYGVEIIHFTTELNKTMAGKHIGKQLLRSGTSAGSNYEESQGAESKADFVHNASNCIERNSRIIILVTAY